MQLAEILRHHAQHSSECVALMADGRAVTWGELNRLVNRIINGLSTLGVSQGSIVATVLTNGIELVALYWVAAKMGAMIVPLSPLLRKGGLATLLRSSDASVVIFSEEVSDAILSVQHELKSIQPKLYVAISSIRHPSVLTLTALCKQEEETEPLTVDISVSDPYDAVYSSGTTGNPKGVVHSHFARIMYALTFALQWQITRESVIFHAGSLVFNGAFLSLLPAAYVGAPFIFLSKWNPAIALETIATHAVTHFVAVPTQIVALLEDRNFKPSRLDSLKMVLSIGAPLHSRYKQLIDSVLPGRFHELYGTTEGIATVLSNSNFQQKPNSVGIPPPFFEIAVLDAQGRKLPCHEIGEITGKSPIAMNGYYGRPDLTAQSLINGWIRSGDMGYMDEDGFLYLVGRNKDVINSGGIKVFPRDIEEVAARHTAVQEAVVFGIPHSNWGEVPVLAVVLRRGSLLGPNELLTWVNENLQARYQRIQDLWIMREFPRNTAGKPLKEIICRAYLQSKGHKTQSDLTATINALTVPSNQAS